MIDGQGADARTPLYEEHVALGARIVPFAGYEMPVQYAGIVEEHLAVRDRVGVFDVCHMAEFRLFGPTAHDALQGLVTNDLDRLDAVGAGQYTLLCNDTGGIIDDMIVYRSGDLEYLIIANAANRSVDFDWMAARLPEDVEFVDESDRTGLVAVQGPESIRVIGELSGDGEMGLPARFHLGEVVLGGIPVLVARTGYTGEDGVEIICRSDAVRDVWRLLLSFPEVMPCGLGARDTLRLEMGYALHGSDIDQTTDPVSAGLGWAVRFGKGAFVGRDAMAQVRADGPVRRLVGLRMNRGEGVPRHGNQVLDGEREVGIVSSGTFSPTLGHGIALAWVDADVADVGTGLKIAIRRRTVDVEVVKVPFVHGTSLSR